MRIHFAMGAEYHKQHFTDIKARLEERGHDCSYDYDGQEIAMLSDAGCTVLTEAPKLYNMNHNLCSKNIFWIDGTRKELSLHPIVILGGQNDISRWWCWLHW